MPLKIHFIGIGGAGMAPLASLAMTRGAAVSGSDLESNEKSRQLAAAGAEIFVGHAAGNVPDDADLIVYSSAVGVDNCERRRGAELGIRQLRRGEFLAEFAASYRRCVAVTGSHGKSSITAALVAILRRCGLEPGFMIGAAVKGLPVCAVGDGDIFVTEADESDGTHTLLKNFLAVVPNVEDDHSWSVGGTAALEANFRTVAANSAHILYCPGTKCDKLFSDHLQAHKLLPVADGFAGLTGFQAVNAAIAVEAAVLLGCDRLQAERAAADYPQVARRMNLIRQDEQVVVIEDYAHHPTEVRCAVEFLRAKYPGYHLCLVFQPHRYARLEKYFEDFVTELAGADSCFILPVFAAWSESGSVDAAMLAKRCGGRLLPDCSPESARTVKSGLLHPAVIAVLGAGDCSEILPFL